MRLFNYVNIAGFTASVAYIYLMLASWKLADVNINAFLLCMAVAWGALLFVYSRSIKIDIKSILPQVIVWGLIFRLIGFVGEPLLEDDHYRYIWDGRTFAEIGNPYAKTPSDSFNDFSLPIDFQIVLDNINNPDLPTIYGPACQLLFLLSFWILPGSLLPLKIFLLLADILSFFMLKRMSLSRGLLLYAWCPLLIKEVSFTAHIDMAGMFFLVASMYFLKQFKKEVSAFFLACATCIKPFPILFLAFLMREFKWRGILTFFIVLFAFYLPFLFLEGNAGLSSTSVFLNEWEFNSALFGFFKYFLNFESSKYLGSALFASLYLIYLSKTWKTPDSSARGEVILGLFFLFSAVINPWYLLWVLPFVVLRPSYTGITALIVISLAYVHGMFLLDSGLLPFQHPIWLRPIEFSLILLALIVDLKKTKTIEDSLK